MLWPAQVPPARVHGLTPGSRFTNQTNGKRQALRSLVTDITTVLVSPLVGSSAVMPDVLFTELYTRKEKKPLKSDQNQTKISHKSDKTHYNTTPLSKRKIKLVVR